MISTFQYGKMHLQRIKYVEYLFQPEMLTIYNKLLQPENDISSGKDTVCSLFPSFLFYSLLFYIWIFAT